MSLNTTYFDTLAGSGAFDTECVDSETSPFFLLRILLSWYFPLFQSKIILLGALKQDMYLQSLQSRWIFPRAEKTFTSALGSFIVSSLGRNSSWPSSGGVWASCSSLDLSANYSNMITYMPSITTSWKKKCSTQGQDPPQ